MKSLNRENILKIYLDSNKYPYQSLNENKENLEVFYNDCNDAIYVKFSFLNEKIQNIEWGGYFCFVAKASANYLANKIIGLSKREAKKYLEDLSKYLEDENNANPEYEIFKIIKIQKSRKRCVKVVINAYLKQIL